MEDYVEVFNATDITFAYLIKAKIEAEGIPVQISNENLQGAYCLDGMVPGVLVPESYAQKAKEIIEQVRQASQNSDDDDQQQDS